MASQRRKLTLTVFKGLTSTVLTGSLFVALFLLVDCAFGGTLRDKVGAAKDSILALRGIGELVGGVSLLGVSILLVLVRRAVHECIDVFRMVRVMVRQPNAVTSAQIKQLRKELDEALLAILRVLDKIPTMKGHAAKIRAFL